MYCTVGWGRARQRGMMRQEVVEVIWLAPCASIEQWLNCSNQLGKGKANGSSCCPVSNVNANMKV